MSEIEDYVNAKQRFVERSCSMSEDRLKELDVLKDLWYKLGQATGLECAAKILMDDAKQHFAEGDGVVAKLFRGASKKIKKLGEDVHPGKPKEGE